eukprot:5837174-Alexandrium_andersonii.AAC.1
MPDGNAGNLKLNQELVEMVRAPCRKFGHASDLRDPKPYGQTPLVARPSREFLRASAALVSHCPSALDAPSGASPGRSMRHCRGMS